MLISAVLALVKEFTHPKKKKILPKKNLIENYNFFFQYIKNIFFNNIFF